MAESKKFQPRKDEIDNWLARSREALEMAEDELREGYFWGAVGRAYYAMFYIVKVVLLDRGIITKTHQGTKAKFHEIFIKTKMIPREFGQLFAKAIDKRNKADYDIREEWTRKQAEELVKNAREFVKTVKKLIK